jgi:glutamate/tyrosine decarboxylase-like PLP-dependent enzyme
MTSSQAEIRTLETALRHARSYLGALGDRPVDATADLEALRHRLGEPLAAHGTAPDAVIDQLVDAVDRGLVGSTGGRSFAWVIGGALPAAVAADWLVATWDQNAALYACSPAASVVEEVAGGWLKLLLGVPAGASVAFVTGCQMAHVTCLAAARTALLRARGWDAETDGLAGAPGIRVLVGEGHHGSIERAVAMLGLGRRSIEIVASDALGRIEPAAFERALAAATGPTIAVLAAGDICTGAFDDFQALIPAAHRAGAWVHIDGAFGLWAAASPRHRDRLRGVEQADSWASDGHKWLNVPFDSGYAFVADPEPHRAALAHRASYLTHRSDARDPLDWNPDWSRRARGFSTYAALRQLGRDGIADLVERCCDHARTLSRGLAALPGAVLVTEPIINQALVRFLDPRSGASETDHDHRTDQVIDAVNASGEALFSGATWRGHRVMRISVCNWRTTEADIARAIAATAAVLRGSPPDHREPDASHAMITKSP